MTDGPPAPTPFREVLKAGFTVTAQLARPRGTEVAPFLDAAQALRGKAAAVTVGDGRSSAPGASALALCSLAGEKSGLDCMLPVAAHGRSAAALQSEFLGAWALGVRNLLVRSFGSEEEKGDSTVQADFCREGREILRLAGALNEGLDGEGEPLGGATAFFTGTVSNPAAKDRDGELRRLESGLKAGAGFTVTLPVFRRGDAEEFLEAAADMGIPVLVSLLPLTGDRQIRLLDESAATPAVPREVRDRIGKTPAAGRRKEGVRLCRELIADLSGLCAGVNVICPDGETPVEEICADLPAVHDAGGPSLEVALRQVSAERGIACRSAFAVAADLGLSVPEVGRAVEELGIRIVGCQLGCFK